jgi:putative intracellular protease/amidase
MAGLAALTLVAAIVWIAAPHATVGSGLPGVLRTAIQLWLVGHHVGFDLRSSGPIGLLPLGLVLLPGALLWRSGRWVVRAGQVARLRHAGYAALALAVPYGLLTGSLAVASRTALSAPSPAQAALAGFLLAFAAGGLGAVRALAPWGRLIKLMPERARCLVVGVTGSLAVLAGAGAVLTGASLIAHATEFRLATDELSPGPAGAILLLLAALAYLPNAVIWAMAYMLGPGFIFGVGTVVAPTGTVLGPLPLFPMLAALPAGSLTPRPTAPGWLGPVLLAVPFLAGAFGGLLTARTVPTPSIEIAPLWGFASGLLTGAVLGALAAFSGGPLGTGRLSATGPSGWQVALVATLELGIAAALTAGLTNWLLIRRHSPAQARIAPANSTVGTNSTAGIYSAGSADPPGGIYPTGTQLLADLPHPTGPELLTDSAYITDLETLTSTAHLTDPEVSTDPSSPDDTEFLRETSYPTDPTSREVPPTFITDPDPEPLPGQANTPGPAETADSADAAEPADAAGPAVPEEPGEPGGRVIYLVRPPREAAGESDRDED